jgi:hypothetical protein
VEVISTDTCQEWFDSNNRREKIYPGRRTTLTERQIPSSMKLIKKQHISNRNIAIRTVRTEKDGDHATM